METLRPAESQMKFKQSMFTQPQQSMGNNQIPNDFFCPSFINEIPPAQSFNLNSIQFNDLQQQQEQKSQNNNMTNENPQQQEVKEYAKITQPMTYSQLQNQQNQTELEEILKNFEKQIKQGKYQINCTECTEKREKNKSDGSKCPLCENTGFVKIKGDLVKLANAIIKYKLEQVQPELKEIIKKQQEVALQQQNNNNNEKKNLAASIEKQSYNLLNSITPQAPSNSDEHNQQTIAQQQKQSITPMGGVPFKADAQQNEEWIKDDESNEVNFDNSNINLSSSTQIYQKDLKQNQIDNLDFKKIISKLDEMNKNQQIFEDFTCKECNQVIKNAVVKYICYNCKPPQNICQQCEDNDKGSHNQDHDLLKIKPGQDYDQQSLYLQANNEFPEFPNLLKADYSSQQNNNGRSSIMLNNLSNSQSVDFSKLENLKSQNSIIPNTCISKPISLKNSGIKKLGRILNENEDRNSIINNRESQGSEMTKSQQLHSTNMMMSSMLTSGGMSQIKSNLKAKFIKQDTYKISPNNDFLPVIEVQNSGEREWPSPVFIKCVQGIYNGQEEKLSESVLLKDDRCQLLMRLDTPKDDGQYITQWRLFYYEQEDENNKEIKYFGPRYNLEFQVFKDQQSPHWTQPITKQLNQKSIINQLFELTKDKEVEQLVKQYWMKVNHSQDEQDVITQLTQIYYEK